jgi:hypothetical protein
LSEDVLLKAGIVYTGGRFTADVNNTGGHTFREAYTDRDDTSCKFATCVSKASGNFATCVDNCSGQQCWSKQKMSKPSILTFFPFSTSVVDTLS